MDSKDSTPIKTSSWYGGFGGEQRWLVVATGGHGWWRRRCWGLGGRLERKRVKNRVFHAEERIYNLQISLSGLVSLRGSPLFVLSMTIHAERNSPCAKCDNSLSAQFPLGLELRLAHFSR